MGKKTKIDWCDHTWSPWWGCVPVSEGCQHCYARGIDKRFCGADGSHWGTATERRFFSDAHWKKPLAWNRAAKKAGVRRRVFPSMCDPFEDRVDLWSVQECLWELIKQTPQLDWLLLTKRPENITHFKTAAPGTMPPNVWLGVTAENQQRADERIPLLLQAPAAVRFLSYEPALDTLDFSGERLEWLSPFKDTDAMLNRTPRLDWIICGAESGPHARPFDEDWARLLRDQCAAAGVPFFFKQTQRAVGGSRKWPDPQLVKMPELDGKVWAEMPVPT